MRAALLQLTSSDDPNNNVRVVSEMVRHAKSEGASFVLTPEVTNCVSQSLKRQIAVLKPEGDDRTLAALREDAARLGIWVLVGSLALKSALPESRFCNRSFLIAPGGDIVARYDKIHMFDVAISPQETYHESRGYAPGDHAVVADTSFGRVGMTICYDLRFPHLYRALAQAGAEILAVPSAFSPATGAAHWETLLRARAIETGAYVLAPAQTGQHPAVLGKSRATYGHSMAVSPWGKVLADGGKEVGTTFVDIHAEEVEKARRRIPALRHDRAFTGPT